MKTHTITAVLILTAFALGWCANGYRIYSGFFVSDQKMLQQLNGK